MAAGQLPYELMSVPVAADAVAAERGSPCAVVEFDLAELHGRGQGGQESAQRGGGQQPPMSGQRGARLRRRVPG